MIDDPRPSSRRDNALCESLALVALGQALQPLTTLLSRSIAAHQVYDWLTLLDREVEHIWRSKWSIPKILFIISRYGVFLDMSIFITGESDSVHCRNTGNADCDSADL